MIRFIWTALIILTASAFGWLGFHLTHTRLPEENTPIHLYSQETRDDLQLAYKQAITEAKKSIYLTIYSLRDVKIINALRDAADHGVSVNILCDKNASSGVAKKLGNGIQTHYRKGKGLMHQKILVVDEKNSYCGSSNLTTASLKMHGNLVLGIYSPALADYLIKKFNNLKQEGLVEALPAKTFSVAGQQLEMRLLPDDSNGVKRLRSVIRSAEKTVKVAMFTWTRFDLANEIIQAQKRGVEVEVVLDRNSATGVSARVAQKLLEAGIVVRVNTGEELLHHKYLLVDNTTLVNGSANWTKAAFVNNDDCFMVLSPLTDEQSTILKKMWSVIQLNSTPYSEMQ
jgi:cardiolipin synthase A/B